MSTVDETPPTLAMPNTPDWSTLETDLHCPRCDYNLRMLTMPRCPECGLEFDWRDLLSAENRARTCPLFEFQWPRRPIRSFAHTACLAICPWRLWRMIRLEYKPRIVALLVSVPIIQIAYFLISTLVGSFVVHTAQVSSGVKPPTLSAYWQSLKSPLSFGMLVVHAHFTLIPLAAVFASIAAFRLTLRLDRVGFGHLLRIALLSWFGWLIAAVLLRALQVLPWVPVYGNAPPWILPAWAPQAAQIAALGVFYTSLALAFSRYLLLRRAWIAAIAAMALATVGIVFVTISLRHFGLRFPYLDPLYVLNNWIPGLKELCQRLFFAGQ